MAYGIVNIPGGASVPSHNHKKSEITDFPSSMAPTRHDSTGTSYGAGDGSRYGHVKLSDSTSSNTDATWGIAATPAAVKAAYDLAKKALDTAGGAMDLTEEILHDLFGDTLPDKTLANNNPETIKMVAQLGIGANIWSVGDKIGVAINGTVGLLSLNGTYYAFILGFNHNPTVEGANSIHFQFGKNATGVDIAFVDGDYGIIQVSDGLRMNLEHSNAGGWESSYMRQTICPAFLAVLPAEWQSIITACTKYSDNTGGTSDAVGNMTTTQDKIWLLSEWESFGHHNLANSAEQDYQQQYDYYKNGNSKIKNAHTDISTPCNWWLRSSSLLNAGDFVRVDEVGTSHSYNSNFSFGFAPACMVA